MTTSTAAVPQEAGRPSAAVLAARVAVVLIALAALLSPVYAALRGLDYLNQPPPPSWGVNTGTSGTAGAGTAGGTGAQTSGGTTTSSGFGGC